MSEQRHSAIGIHSLDGDATADAGELLKRRQIVRRTRIAALVAVVLLALGAGRTVLSRMSNARTLEANSARQSVQYVKTTTAKPGSGAQTVQLPGTLQGAVQAPISARASGYLKRWTKDIGSRVREGELLA